MEENYQQVNQMDPTNRKGLPAVWVTILIILSLAAGAAGGYYYFKYKNNKTNNSNTAVTTTPTSTNTLPSASGTVSVTSTASADATADWKTYTNTKYNYTFKYPQSWGLIDYLYNSNTKQQVDKFDFVNLNNEAIAENSVPIGDYGIFFRIAAISSIPTDNGPKESYKQSSINFNGITGTKLIFTAPSAIDGSFGTTIYFTHNNQSFAINWNNDNQDGAHNNNFDTILSTFKFTQ